MKMKRLGRGLSGLLNPTEAELPPAPVVDRMAPAPSSLAPRPAEDGGPRRIPVASVRPNPYQPRTAFREEALEELRDSIRRHGVLQPVVVRRTPTGFELVAGERRLRAVQSLQMAEIPAVVRETTDEEMQTLALVENLQREDLNALEQARALQAMMRNFGLTQEDVAARVGKARTTIANVLRLLDLPAAVQKMVEDGALTGAHARAILQAKGDDRRLLLARACAQEGLSVREVERRAALGPTIGKPRAARPDPFIADLEDRLRRVLSSKVRIQPSGKGGRIEIRYHDATDLDRLLEILKA